MDNGEQSGTHWTSFHVKNNESFYFNGFSGQADKILFNQLPKQRIYHNYKIRIKILNYVAFIVYIFSI